MAKLGNVFLNTVYEETPEKRVKTPDHPIESGINVVDHIQREPLIFNISGVVTGPDASVRLSAIKTHMDRGDRLKYVYRNVFPNMIIEDFSTTHDVEVNGGFKFEMKLKQIFIAKAAIVVDLPKPEKRQAKKVSNKGRKQTTGDKKKRIYVVKSGDSLSKIASKYNMSWPTLYDKNKKVVGSNPNLIYPGQKLVI